MNILVLPKELRRLIEKKQLRAWIRKPSKSEWEPSETTALRVWEAKPFGSKQIGIANIKIRSVVSIRIEKTSIIKCDSVVGLWRDNIMLTRVQANSVARECGFRNAVEMAEWLREGNGGRLPIEGELIEWIYVARTSSEKK